MDSAFDKLDAAGFLEIWQHFDADGENIWCYFFHLLLNFNVKQFYSDYF